MVRRDPKNYLGDCSKCIYKQTPCPVEGSCGMKGFQCSCEDYDDYEVFYTVILLRER